MKKLLTEEQKTVLKEAVEEKKNIVVEGTTEVAKDKEEVFRFLKEEALEGVRVDVIEERIKKELTGEGTKNQDNVDELLRTRLLEEVFGREQPEDDIAYVYVGTQGFHRQTRDSDEQVETVVSEDEVNRLVEEIEELTETDSSSGIPVQFVTNGYYVTCLRKQEHDSQTPVLLLRKEKYTHQQLTSEDKNERLREALRSEVGYLMLDETRTKEDVRLLLDAVASGVPVITTIHGNGKGAVISRLASLLGEQNMEKVNRLTQVTVSLEKDVLGQDTVVRVYIGE